MTNSTPRLALPMIVCSSLLFGAESVMGGQDFMTDELESISQVIIEGIEVTPATTKEVAPAETLAMLDGEDDDDSDDDD